MLQCVINCFFVFWISLESTRICELSATPGRGKHKQGQGWSPLKVEIFLLNAVTQLQAFLQSSFCYKWVESCWENNSQHRVPKSCAAGRALQRSWWKCKGQGRFWGTQGTGQGCSGHTPQPLSQGDPRGHSTCFKNPLLIPSFLPLFQSQEIVAISLLCSSEGLAADKLNFQLLVFCTLMGVLAFFFHKQLLEKHFKIQAV